MSFKPLPLAVFFPPGYEFETLQDSVEPMEVDQEAPESTTSAHNRTASHESAEAGSSSSSNTQPTSSVQKTRDEKRSSTWWDDTETYETQDSEKIGEEECWEEYEGQADEQDATGLIQSSKHVWLSDEEKLRVAFRRASISAQRVDLDRSPAFPRSLAEYVGVKADGIEEKAARLKAKVEVKEGVVRARERGERRSVLVVRAAGQIEQKLVTVCHGEESGSGFSGQPSSAGHNLKRKKTRRGRKKGAGSSNTVDSDSGQGQGSSAAGQTTSTDTTETTWAPHSYFACPVTDGWIALNARDLGFYEPFPIPVHQDHYHWPFADAACTWPYPHAYDTFGDHRGLGSPFCLKASGHRRTNSAPFLREVASHAALRRSAFGGDDQHQTGNTRNDWGWFGDEAYDSDSSFTPSDYRPSRNTNKGNEAAGNQNVTQVLNVHSDSWFPANYHTTVSEEARGPDDMSRNAAEEFFFEHTHLENSLENNGFNDSEASSFNPSDYKLDKLKFYTTLDGKLEPKGKGKANNYIYDGQGDAEDKFKPINEDPSKNRISSDNGRYLYHASVKEELTEEEHHVKTEAPNGTSKSTGNTKDNTPVTIQPGAPSSTSTFTPSDYDPRKLAFNATKPKPNLKPPSLNLKTNLHLNLRPSSPTLFSPLHKPTLATLPLSLTDNLSPVLAHANNPFTPSHHPPDCDWPTTAEFTAEGEARIKKGNDHAIYNDHDHTPPFFDFAFDTVCLPEDRFERPLPTPFMFGPVPVTVSDSNSHANPIPGLGPNMNINMTAAGPVPGPAGHGTEKSNVGRYLPIPRLKSTVDPRLDLTLHEEVGEWLSLVDGHHLHLPWEMRMMAGERRWDLHADRRIREVWRVRWGDEEEGWECLEEGAVGVQMARGLVGWEDETNESLSGGSEEGDEEEGEGEGEGSEEGVIEESEREEKDGKEEEDKEDGKEGAVMDEEGV